MSACGNKGDLFLPPDAQLVQELDSVGERITEGSPSSNTTETELPETDGVTDNDTTTGQPTPVETDETDEVKPAKKPQP